MKSSEGILSLTPSVWESPVRIVYRFIVWSPWVWLTLFCLFVLATTLQVGHLPVYGQPDPKYAGLISTLFYMPTILLLIWVVGTTPVGVILTIIRLWRGFPKSVRWGEVIFYLGGIGLFYLFILSDVAGLMTWLAD
jgi:hypothetical protein